MTVNDLARILVVVLIISTIFIIKGLKIKDIISLFFIIYLLFLATIVTIKQDIYYTFNFIPFKEILRYNIENPLFLKNVIGNILLFMPLGFLIAYKLNLKHFYSAIILIFYFSFSIEFIELFIGRIFDIDDILLNTLGGVIGYIIFKVFFNQLKK